MGIFVCAVCGHIEFGAAPDRCPVCFAPKERFQQNDNVFADAEAKSGEGAAKHTPVINVVKECGLIPEQSCTDVLLRVGKVLHPSEPAHFISWIDGYVDDRYVARVMLTPGVNPAACFHLKQESSRFRVVVFCNIHGHWRAEAAA
jgi:superoxide reductase